VVVDLTRIADRYNVPLPVGLSRTAQ